MRSIQHDIASGLAMSVLTLALASAWGSPFISAANAQEPAPQQQSQAQPQAKTFTGTIVKDGEQFSLRDSSGKTFKLDSPELAKPFEGKNVQVKGQLDEQAMIIHVQDIQSADA